MFSDADFALSFSPVSTDAQLILIPISDDYGVIGVAKAFGNGKAACMVFAPAIKLGSTLDGFEPKFLRKVVTSDFALRTNQWKAVGLSNANAKILSDTVSPLMSDLETLTDEQIEVIEMEAPTNISSAPAVATNAYRAPDDVPFEPALCHLLGISIEAGARKNV